MKPTMSFRKGTAEEALTKILTTMMGGSVPDDVAPFLQGSTLAIKKMVASLVFQSEIF